VSSTETPTPESGNEANRGAGAGFPADAAASDDGGRRPPTYAAAASDQPMKLDYRVERGDDAGSGQLSWEPQADGQYRARFWGEAGNSALMDWVSRGRHAATGLAPERMVERQRGVEVRAVNFQRDQGVISFSGSTRAVPLFNGAQDRVSVLWQLAAIAQARTGGLKGGDHVRVQVAGTRGQAEEWRFEVTGTERLGLDSGPVDAVHLVREPARPYDQRVELWLAPQAGHVPVALRFTPVPGKASSSFWLRGALPPAPSPPPPAPDFAQGPSLRSIARYLPAAARRTPHEPGLQLRQLRRRADHASARRCTGAGRGGEGAAAPGAYEIVDKFAKKGIFIEGALALRFRRASRRWPKPACPAPRRSTTTSPATPSWPRLHSSFIETGHPVPAMGGLPSASPWDKIALTSAVTRARWRFGHHEEEPSGQASCRCTHGVVPGPGRSAGARPPVLAFRAHPHPGAGGPLQPAARLEQPAQPDRPAPGVAGAGAAPRARLPAAALCRQ
jgi:hypothetical protein